MVERLDEVALVEVILQIDEVVVTGDWAFSRGTFRGTYQPVAGGPPSEEATIHLVIWHRQPDASCKVLRDIWNNDTPGHSLARE